MLQLYFFLLFCSFLFAQPPLPTPRIFTKISQCCTQHPEVSVTVENCYKIISGGAYVKWQITDDSPGVLLVSSYPSDNLKTWYANAKDHDFPESAYIIAYAVAIEDPNNNFDVSLFKSSWSERVQHPTTSVSVGVNYVLTGGGARIDYGNGAGNLLWGSYPSSENTWTVNGKDHSVASPATIMAFAIGIKPLNDYSRYTFYPGIHSVTSNPPTSHNSINMDHDCLFPTGGGALVHWSNHGALLTASYPLSMNTTANGSILVGWGAESKDHEVIDLNTVTVYTVCVNSDYE